MEPWIKFEHSQFNHNEIRSELSIRLNNEFEKSAFQFCFEWLSGKESFTLQTSGSTGVPKQITVSRDQLKASANLTAVALGLQKNGTSLVCLDTRYIAGIMMMVRSLEVGMNMIIVTPSSNPLEKINMEEVIDFTALVPIQLDTILKSGHKEKLNQIKIALIGGAALSRKTVNDIGGMNCNFFATYGMTETLSHIALQKLNGPNAQDYFESLPGITVSKDDRGCLKILAPHISEEPIVTNDLVEFITPSQFHWLGRADTIINTGGVKVIPEKVEASISSVFDQLAITNRFFVEALPDVLLGESVNLFLEGAPLQKEMQEMIEKKIKEAVNRFERPKSIQYISKFVDTDTGKINKVKTIASIRI